MQNFVRHCFDFHLHLLHKFLHQTFVLINVFNGLFFRVYLGYHTFGQVSCGALLGIFLGALWFAVVQLILTPCFPYLASQ